MTHFWMDYGDVVRDWCFLTSAIAVGIMAAHYGLKIVDVIFRVIGMAML